MLPHQFQTYQPNATCWQPLAKTDTSQHILPKEHFFQTESTGKAFTSEIKSKANNPSWLIGILLLIFALYSWIKFRYNKKTKRLLEVFVNTSFARAFVFEDQYFFGGLGFFLRLLFILIIGLLIILINKNWSLTSSIQVNLLSYSIICLSLIIFSLIRYIMHFVIGFIFNIHSLVTNYLQNSFVFGSMLSMLLLPVIIGASFMNLIPQILFIKLALIILIIFLLVSGLKAFWSGISSFNISPLYIFLYICTLEILPLVVSYRLLIVNN